MKLWKCIFLNQISGDTQEIYVICHTKRQAETHFMSNSEYSHLQFLDAIEVEWLMLPKLREQKFRKLISQQ